MTELAAFVLTLVTLGALTGVGAVGIVLMERVLGVESTPDSLVSTEPEPEPTGPPRGAV
ncbi:hypothetical protein [Halomarina oriensis]|uniref:Uncharacterized protein n=1 Tax=Halomarina oriensis TaxID=671145 RepID=A0A6B0GSB5_9EURY|nr:hypothetical protein [Halomarina oriensis]MWG34985.1 hypothetical protein [Halomarina oriensis]